jgi:hypothetical protein
MAGFQAKGHMGMDAMTRQERAEIEALIAWLDDKMHDLHAMIKIWEKQGDLIMAKSCEIDHNRYLHITMHLRNRLDSV